MLLRRLHKLCPMKKVDHELQTRLYELPKTVYTAVYQHCLDAAKLSHVAWGNMLRGSSPNLAFVIELCDIFEISPRQLLDPHTRLDPETAQRVLAINA